MMHLSISETDAASFATPLIAALPAEVVKHGGVTAAALKMIQGLDELAAPDTCKLRAEKFGITDSSLLSERVIWRNGQKIALAGLRFRMLNKRAPFAHLTLNFLPSHNELAQLREKLEDLYKSIPILGFTLRQAPNLFSDLPHEKWTHTIFGSTTTISALEFPPGVSPRWGGVDFISDYDAEFSRLLTAEPERNTYLRAEEESDLRLASENGLLLSLYDEKGWGGVIAAMEKNFFGAPSLYIFENILAERMRGKGLGKTLQAEFLSKLSPRFPAVFGHINQLNLASLGTALSMGRKVVFTEYFFPLQ